MTLVWILAATVAGGLLSVIAAAAGGSSDDEGSPSISEKSSAMLGVPGAAGIAGVAGFSASRTANIPGHVRLRGVSDRTLLGPGGTDGMALNREGGGSVGLGSGRCSINAKRRA